MKTDFMFNYNLSDTEIRDFNKSLMKMILNLESENKVLKEKLKIMEDIVKNSSIPVIGGLNKGE